MAGETGSFCPALGRILSADDRPARQSVQATTEDKADSPEHRPVGGAALRSESSRPGLAPCPSRKTPTVRGTGEARLKAQDTPATSGRGRERPAGAGSGRALTEPAGSAAAAASRVSRVSRFLRSGLPEPQVPATTLGPADGARRLARRRAPPRALALPGPSKLALARDSSQAASSFTAKRLCSVVRAALRAKRRNLQPDSELAPSVYVKKKHILALRKTDRI